LAAITACRAGAPARNFRAAKSSTRDGRGLAPAVGPGETTGSVGIGGSGSTPPSGAFQPNSSSGVVVPPAPGSAPNASVPYGSGAVSPLGPGESSGSAGIGGSGTSALRQ
jgi:hypothetical protein